MLYSMMSYSLGIIVTIVIISIDILCLWFLGCRVGGEAGKEEER